jgi:single-strand DNA-binding protein
MNKFIGVGRLTRDPEIRYTQTGKVVASFNIAIDSGYGDNKKTDFVPIVAWDKLAEVVGNNLGKGRRILVEGRLQIRDYEHEGQKKRQAEIVAQNIEFLDSKNPASNRAADEGSPMDKFGTEVFPEEEIPF